MATPTTDNDDLLGDYLAEDPKDLSEEQLKEAADIFGVPLDEVKNIVKGMTNAREEVKQNIEDDELITQGDL